MAELLEAAVAAFIEEITPALVTLSEVTWTPVEAAREVTLDALNLVRGFIGSDERLTNEELHALIASFAPRLQGELARAQPEDLRPKYFAGATVGLQQPSPLFDVLLKGDERRGTHDAWTYYQGALRLAYAVCATDMVPSYSELAALGRFRSMLFDHLDEAQARPANTVPSAPSAARPSGQSSAAPTELNTPDPEVVESLEEVMAELDELVGLEAVKREVKLVTDFLRVQQLRKEHGLPVVEQSRHLVFTGNPGTGKTTVARLLSRIYKVLGAVDKGQLIETDRAALVAGFVGQTAPKVTEVVKSALGGVLLIDEAYTLARGSENDFGLEAIDTLVKLMEDHRDDFAVIAAGYPVEMSEFIESNPGLRSRFPKTIEFPDYTTDELLEIFKSFCKKNAYSCDKRGIEALRRHLDSQPRTKGFGNARLARNIFEAAIGRQASRVVQADEHTKRRLMTLTAGDIIDDAPE